MRTFLIFLTCFLFSQAFPLPAGAQIKNSSQIQISTGTSDLKIGPNIFVTKDPEKKLSAKTVATRYENNLRGERMQQNIINMGPQAAPVWIVFTVVNNSNIEDWILDFGRPLPDGRTAVVNKLLAINHTKEEIIIKALKDDGKGAHGQGLQAGALPLKITPGKTETFVIFLEPGNAMAQTIAPTLIRADQYINILEKNNLTDLLNCLLMIGLIGFFAALALTRKNLSYLFLSGYLALNSLLYISSENLFFSATPFINVLPVFLYAGLPVCAGFITKKFLNISLEKPLQNNFIFSVAILVLFSTLLSALIINPASIADDIILHGSILLAFSTIFYLSFAEGRNGNTIGYVLAATWFSAFLGISLLWFVSINAIALNPFTVNAYWVSLLPQSFFLVMASIVKIRKSEEEERHLRAREDRTARSMARLMHSKESADQARLLRVIERERELMTELREREMQRTEEMRQAKEVADEANRAKSAFLAVVSHEIRTPMTGILGMVRLLDDTNLDKEQSEYIQTIHQSGETMLALLNDILDFEKIERGSMNLENIDFNLPRLIQDVVTLMSGHAADKGLEIKTDIPEGFPEYVVGDPTRLRQVLLNLISNAIKFTDEGNVIVRLKHEKGRNQGRAEKQNITFEISDTGIGISESGKRNIFSPFTQADKSVSRKYGGTGLGLAISKRLVEAMGGAIGVESKEGEGSTFSFKIPLPKGSKKGAKNEKQGKARLKEKLPSMRILVIEDNEMNARVIRGFLEKEGHDVIVQYDAETGIKTLKKGGFAAVLTDINLSGASGLEVVKSIRSMDDNVFSHMPVIAITGNVSETDVENYKQAGFSGYIAKPFEPEKLNETLKKIYDGTFRDTSKMQTTQPQKSQETNQDDLNMEMIGRLLDTLGKPEFEKLINGFWEKTDELINDLEPLSGDEALETIRARAHELRGMAANFGINALSETAKDIEKAAENKDAESAQEKIKTLRTQCEKARTAFAAWLSEKS